MALNRGEVNPLSVLKLRKLAFLPEHFTKIRTAVDSEVKLIDHWINFNLNSRYAIKKTFTLDQDNKMIEVIEIGIEDPREVAMLILGCPYLHKRK